MRRLLTCNSAPLALTRRRSPLTKTRKAFNLTLDSRLQQAIRRPQLAREWRRVAPGRTWRVCPSLPAPARPLSTADGQGKASGERQAAKAGRAKSKGNLQDSLRVGGSAPASTPASASPALKMRAQQVPVTSRQAILRQDSNAQAAKRK